MNKSSIKTKVKPAVIIAAFAYVYLFAYTAHAKWAGHEKFVTTLSKSPLIGPEYAEVIAWAIPITEAVLALLLIFPPLMKKALWASVALMTVFTSYLIYMVLSGLPRTCNCGGVIESLTWPQHIAFNLFFIFLVPIAIYWSRIKQFIKKLSFTNLHDMLRLIVSGMALGVIAVGSSAYTQKAENEMIVGEVYVNTSTSPDQYEILTSPYSDINCQNLSDMTCSYIRTNLDPGHELPTSFTEEEAEEFIEEGWLVPNSSQKGLYTP